MKTLHKKLALFIPPILLGVVGCSSRSAPIRPVSASIETLVSLQTPRKGDISKIVEVSGSLVAIQDVALSAKQGGKLAQVFVREGDQEGQILARVDSTDLESQVRVDQAEVASAAAKVDQAKAAYEQEVTNVKAGIDSASASLAQQVASSQAQIKSAESALASAKASLSTTLEGARPEERNETQASLAVAQANYAKAESDLKRYKHLHDAGAISDADFDQYQNSRDIALANLNSAQAALRLQNEGNRAQDIDRAREAVRQAEETLRQNRAQSATNEMRRADLETAIATRKQNNVKLADIQSAKASLLEAQSTLAIAEQAVADTIVRSPITGCISQRLAEPGQVVTSSSVLLHVVSTGQVYFEPSVPDSSSSDLRVGEPVSVQVDAYPGRFFSGSVTSIYPQSSTTNRSLPIRVVLGNRDGQLKPNMFAHGDVTTLTHKNVIIIPTKAILTKDSKTQVFVYKDGKAKVRSVNLGISSPDGNSTEVNGIQPQDEVIVSGLKSISEGQIVNPQIDAANGKVGA
jgi:HlyD family secretion protein